MAESQQAKQDLAVIGRTLSPGAVSFDVTWLDSDNASIHIKKSAEETQSGERKVAGITFTLTSVNDPSVKVTLVTDANGEARAEHLKPGTYTISESAQNREYAALPDSKVVLENNKTLEYSVRNILERRTVKIQKLDAQTQTLITADKAEFQILDTAGKPVRLKVKGAENATGVFGTNENGEVLFEDKLSAGKYILHERKAPENYTTAEDIPFAVDADSPAEITLRSMDAPVMKKIRIIKKSEDGDTCGAGFRFLIKPSGDITDGSGNERKMEAQTVTTDESGTAVSGDLYPGTYLVTETAVPAGSGWTVNPQTYTVDVKGDPDSGSEVTLSVSDSKNRFIICKHTAGEDSQPLENITFSVTEKGENTKPSLYRTGKDGRIELDGLSNGRTYEIREVETRPGYNLDPAVYTITVDNTGLIEGRREYTLDLSNQPNIVRFSKKDIVEGEDGAELPGAELIVKNEHGEKIDSWISTNKPHEITSLPAGKYELTERAAPEGYELSEQSVRFTVENSLSIQKVVMYDRPYREVDISKLDITTGEELPGASLEVTDSDGNRVDAWVSTGQPHRLTLPSGVYLLTEKIPAAGYTTAEAVTFEVKTAAEKGDIQVQNVQMKDAPTKIYIHKQDITTSKELPGAKLRITDKDGKTVEEWISTKKPHEIEKLPAGEYTLTEITAPDGYETAESVPFEVKDSSEALHVVMKDSPKIAPGTKRIPGQQDLRPHPCLPETIPRSGGILRRWRRPLSFSWLSSGACVREDGRRENRQEKNSLKKMRQMRRSRGGREKGSRHKPGSFGSVAIVCIGVVRFELTTSRPPAERATKLRHTPVLPAVINPTGFIQQASSYHYRRFQSSFIRILQLYFLLAGFPISARTKVAGYYAHSIIKACVLMHLCVLW